MVAVKLVTVIPTDRHLVLEVPFEVPAGDAEVIILSRLPQRHGNGLALLRYLRGRQFEPRRSAEQIDCQIEEERRAWE